MWRNKISHFTYMSKKCNQILQVPPPPPPQAGHKKYAHVQGICSAVTMEILCGTVVPWAYCIVWLKYIWHGRMYCMRSSTFLETSVGLKKVSKKLISYKHPIPFCRRKGTTWSWFPQTARHIPNMFVCYSPNSCSITFYFWTIGTSNHM